MTQLIPNGKQQFIDINGKPLVGGKLYFYEVGTETPKATYQDADLTVLNTNPIVFDARGQASIYGAGRYRQVLRDATGVLIWDQVIVDPSASIDQFIQDLSNYTDLQKGAYMVGRSTPQIKTIADLRTVGGRYDGDQALVLGYYSDTPGQGGGLMRWAPASVLADDGGTVFAVTGIATGRWFRVYSRLEAPMFGAVPGDVDRTSRMQAARDYIAAQLLPSQLVFPAGIYKYSVSPNWAIPGAHIVNEGEVRFRYTGTGNAVTIDAGPNPTDLCFDMQMGRIIVEAPATAGHGVLVRSIHHSRLGFRVDGCGSASAAIKVEFAVVTKFDQPEASINSAGDAWYLNAKPKYGLWLSRRGTPEQCAYCMFDNPIMEGVDIGAFFEWTLGNKLIGGTLEGCTNTGASFAAGALRDVIDHTDFEVNVNADIFCSGSEIEIRSVDSDSKIIINSGSLNYVNGGTYKNITINAGAANTRLDNVVYNRDNLGGLLTDNGSRTRISNSQNVFGTQYPHDAKPTVVGIPSTASAFTNTTGNNIVVYTVGGVVSQINLQKPPTAASATGSTSGGTLLNPGDIISWVFSSAPSAYYTAG